MMMMMNNYQESVVDVVLARVITDVADLFLPTVEMSVNYGSLEITNGFHIHPSYTSNPPTVTIAAGRPPPYEELYTVVMTDADARRSRDPTFREWMHWMVADIRGGWTADNGREIVPYVGVGAEVGPLAQRTECRYVVMLFEQRARMPLPIFRLHLVDSLAWRGQFTMRQLARELGLRPVSIVYFRSTLEPRPRYPDVAWGSRIGIPVRADSDRNSRDIPVAPRVRIPVHSDSDGDTRDVPAVPRIENPVHAVSDGDSRDIPVVPRIEIPVHVDSDGDSPDIPTPVVPECNGHLENSPI